MLSAALFEAVFTHSPIGHYLLSPTPDAIILAVNDAFLAASACSRRSRATPTIPPTRPRRSACCWQRPATAHALLVAITGYGQDSDRRLAAEAGFDRHLVKPIDLDSLRDALASRPT